MKFIKKYENFEIDSKSKEIGEVKRQMVRITLPEKIIL